MNKNNFDENLGWTLFGLAIMGMLCTLIISVTVYNIKADQDNTQYQINRTRNFTQNNYCETTAVGSSQTMWVKCPAVK